MLCALETRAKRRYTIRIAISMSAYVAALYLSQRSVRHFHPGHLVTVLLAILPAIPILAVIASVGIYLREESDEFQRELLIQTLLWGMGGTLALTTIWGFLEAFAGAPHLPAFYVFVAFWLFVAMARWPLRRYYQAPDE